MSSNESTFITCPCAHNIMSKYRINGKLWLLTFSLGWCVHIWRIKEEQTTITYFIRVTWEPTSQLREPRLAKKFLFCSRQQKRSKIPAVHLLPTNSYPPLVSRGLMSAEINWFSPTLFTLMTPFSSVFLSFYQAMFEQSIRVC